MTQIVLLLYLLLSSPDPGMTWIDYESPCVGDEVTVYNHKSGDGEYVWLTSSGSEQPIVSHIDSPDLTLKLPSSGYLWVCRGVLIDGRIIEGNSHVVTASPHCNQDVLRELEMCIKANYLISRELEKYKKCSAQ